MENKCENHINLYSCKPYFILAYVNIHSVTRMTLISSPQTEQEEQLYQKRVGDR